MKKNKLIYFLRKRFKYQLKFYLKKKLIHWPIYKEINLPFSPTINYNAFQSNFIWIKSTIINFKYHKWIDIIKTKSKIMKRRRNFYYIKYSKMRHFFIFNFLYLYNNFFFNINTNVYYLKKKYLKKKKLLFFLIFSFKKKTLFINLQNFKKKNIFFISPGFFIKFFEKKKSLKKNKNIKLLMAKCLRKLYLLNKVKNNILIIKNNPVFFNEMFNFLNTPIIHKFENPFNEQIIEEKQKKKPIFKILSFIFLNNISYSKTKSKKKGRIKRKILRKLIINNKITD